MIIIKIKKTATKQLDDTGECWINWWLIENNPAMSELDIFQELGIHYSYTQPGGIYEGHPSIWRVGKRCIVTQICGYDV